MKKRLDLIDTGVLYRNPAPGHVAICAFYPSLVVLSEKELLCVYRVGQALYSADGRLAALRSTDGGRTWQQAGMVWDPSNNAPSNYSYTAPFISRLRSGAVIVLAKRLVAEHIDLAMFNPDTGGKKPSQLVLLQSEDNGNSWSPPALIDLPDGEVVSSHTSVIDLDDGRWMLCFERWKAWERTEALHIRGFAMFSGDRGKTWGQRVDFPSASDDEKMYSHSQYRRRRDGQIWALQWAQGIGGQTNFDVHLVTADPTGRHWSDPRPTGIPGQTSCIADLGDGMAVAAYSKRESGKPGIMAVHSEDDGANWDLEHEVMVWDAVGQEFLGVAHKPTYPASHDNIAFGKPDTVTLPDGDIIVSWWCTQACVTHIRYARLRLV